MEILFDERVRFWEDGQLEGRGRRTEGRGRKDEGGRAMVVGLRKSLKKIHAYQYALTDNC